MKRIYRKIPLLFILLMLLSLLLSCRGGDAERELQATSASKELHDGYFEQVTASDYVTLGQYAGLSVSRSALDRAWGETVQNILAFHTVYQSVPRSAEWGDQVTYSMTVMRADTGKTMENLGGSERTLVLSEAPSAEDYVGLHRALFGHSAHSAPFSASLRLSDTFSADSELNGLAVQCALTVTDVAAPQIPDRLTDSMVESYTRACAGQTQTEIYTSVEAYRAALDERNTAEQLWPQITQNAYVRGFPQAETDRLEQEALDVYREQAAQQQLTLEEYLPAVYGVQDYQTALSWVREESISRVKEILVYLAIYEREALESESLLAQMRTQPSYAAYPEQQLALLAKIAAAEHFVVSHCVYGE